MSSPQAPQGQGEWSDDEMMRRILMHHRYLNFVQRLLNPERYPAITKDPRLPPGSYATHQMSDTTIESGPMKGRSIAYPNIVYDQQNGLRWLDPRDAVMHALRTGEYIPFQSPEAAAQFASKYKRGTNIPMPRQ